MSQTKVTREGRKLEAPVTLFAAIETEDHEFLRALAFRERRSLADVVREAIHAYRRKKGRAAPRAPRDSTR